MLFDKDYFAQFYVAPENRTHVDTLILVGNGFDCWQGLDTSYRSFEKYYYEHIDEVLSKLGIPKRTLCDDSGAPVLDSNGNPITYCDVELFYGDPKNPQRLPHSFWWDFETSLDKVDDQELNFFFGKDRSGIKNIRTCANNAQRILREIFGDWISEIEIERRVPQFDFGNSIIVNFNYTDTLLKRFGVHSKNEFHIHGTANDKSSIIFGHATHPEEAYTGLNMGMEHPRFLGLYYIEEFLYNADKHTEDNYMRLRIFLALHGVCVEDIKKIYVLGLGCGPSDAGYIKNLIHATQGIEEDKEADLTVAEKIYLNSCDYDSWKMLNMQYAIGHRERVMKKSPISYPEYEALDEWMASILDDPYYHISKDAQGRLEVAAVRRRFWGEQELRNKKVIKEYLRMLDKRFKCGQLTMEEAFLVAPEKTRNKLSGAEWHISYHSDTDRERIERLLTQYKCNNFRLHSSIDECIEPFRIPPTT